MDVKPGEYVMQSLFADFTIQAEKKIEEAVLFEPQVRVDDCFLRLLHWRSLLLSVAKFDSEVRKKNLISIRSCAEKTVGRFIVNKIYLNLLRKISFINILYNSRLSRKLYKQNSLLGKVNIRLLNLI